MAQARVGDSSPGGRWGHFAPQILIGTVFATVLLAVVPPPPGSPVAPLTPLLLVAVVLATWVKMRRHDRGLCEHCVRSMPINPSREAERHRRRLALAHVGGRPPVVAGYLAVLLGSDVAVALAPSSLLPVALTLWAGVQSTLVYLVLSHVTHRRLQPWCPQCGGGGRGDDEHTRDPEPSGFRSR